MKIVLLSNLFPPGFVGGYELGALDVAQGLSERGHEVLVLTSDYFQDEAGALGHLAVDRSLECVAFSHHEVAEAHRERARHHLNMPNIRRVGSALRTFRPDVVLAFNLHGLGAIGMLHYLMATKTPTVLYLMDNIFSGLNRHGRLHQAYEHHFGALPIDGLAATVAMSRNVASEVSRTLGATWGSTTYVPGWVDLRLLESGPDGAPADQDPSVRFVYSSRISPSKGIKRLLGAVEGLLNRGVTHFSVDVYGAGEVANFLHEVHVRQLNQHVRYMGEVPKAEMLRRFARYDALVFPTWQREPFGFVAAEAAAAGCVPIMTAGIGASEWFFDGIDCLKISPSAASLQSAMASFIERPPGDRARLRRATSQAACHNLSLERWLPVIEGICWRAQDASHPYIERTRPVETAMGYLHRLWSDALG